VQVNAALAAIHAAGLDPALVSQAAGANIALGMSASQANQAAINRYLDTKSPDVRRTVAKMVDLIQHSDDATVAAYDRAINAYNATGNDAELSALAPMMARDAVALSLRRGEITQAQIDSGEGISAALGYEPSAEIRASLQAPAAAPQAAPQQAPVPALSPAQHSFTNGAQAGGAAAGQGYRPGMTGERLARWHGAPLAVIQHTQSDADGR
jgi:hypothetical protein